jgi:hypothetical protein
MTRIRWTHVTLAAVPALLLLVVGAVVPALRTPSPVYGAAPAPEDSLRRAVAFLEARAAGAREAAMALDIDPATGTVELRHGGVTLRRVTPDRIAVSAGIRHAHPDSAFVARVSDRWGMLPPEPVRHVTAPADTAEANRTPTDVPTESASAFVTLACGDDLIVRLQPSDAGMARRISGALYRVAERISANVSGLLRGTHPEEITLRLTHSDALAIYRALSEGDAVTVRTGPSSGGSRR